jgi:predicted NAD-dependent protein-ADP-ribosyltransferase YbiA (DUF1768 family)
MAMSDPQSAKTIAFTKVDLPYGWLGNMAPFPVAYEDLTYRTSEALFQALRFEDRAIREQIRAEKSPMAAKMRAKRHAAQRVVVPLSPPDVDNMRLVLALKLRFHPPLRRQLRETGDALIVEDCSKRARGSGLFWGAALVDGAWKGENTLGRLWMALRNDSLTA